MPSRTDRIPRTWLLLAGFALTSACGEDAAETPAPRATYHADVAPLLAKHCAGCHRQGGIAPFALDNFAAAKAYAGLIAEVTANRSMPPFLADNSGMCGTFQDARWLSDREIQTFADWVADGAPQGKAASLHPEPPLPAVLEDVAMTLMPAAPYTPDASLSDDYRCFVIDAGLSATAYLTGFEVRTANPQMAHHIILYAAATTDAIQAARDLDAADPGEGYTCFGSSGVAGAGMVGGWAPGKNVTVYPQGTGVPIAAGTTFIMQLHYNTLNGVAPDQTQVDLQMAAQVDRKLEITALRSADLVLLPGKEEQTAQGTSSLTILPPGGIELYGLFPHMHQLGTRLTVELERDGDTECLLDADRWNFHWQQLFLYERPLHVARSTGQVRLTCTYDTTSRNELVTWGEGTQDEMCLNYFFYSY